MQRLVTLIIDLFFGSIKAKIQAWFVNLCMDFLGVIEQGTLLLINSDPLLQGLSTLAQGLGWAVFGVSLVLTIVDVGEELAGLKSGQFVDLSDVLLNIIKGAGFIIVAPQLALQLMNLVAALTGSLNVDYTAMQQYYAGLTFDAAFSLLIPLVMIVAVIAFFCMNLVSSIKIYIYSITVFLYVPDIVRGRTTAMGDWARPCIAVLLTYALRHIFFMIGLTAALQGSIISMAFGWIAMVVIPKTLEKYGASSGFAGLAARTVSAGQSFATTIARFVH